jgi:hypothetical protein
MSSEHHVYWHIVPSSSLLRNGCVAWFSGIAWSLSGSVWVAGIT